ncbi:MAG: replication initiation protein [Nitrospinae bacterium]|nr:replication initiation protein [Nitrospinota bacterium]
MVSAVAKNHLITKSNEIIEARYKMSLNEQRLVLTSISQIEPENKEFGIYIIKVKDYIDLFNVSNKDIYGEIEGIVKKLRKRKISFMEDGSLVDANWVSAAKYSPEENQITIEFPQLLKPYLLQLKEHFTTYKMKNIIYLKSNYVIRIYEILKQYEKIGKRIITLKDLRNILGVEEDEYKLFGHFNERILKFAQKQICERTDICFKYNTIKKGRKVDAIEFIIFAKKNKDTQLTLPNTDPPPFEHQDLFDDIVSNGITPRQAETFFKEHDADQIKRNFDLFKNDLKAGVINTSPKGYLANAIMKDYAYISPKEQKNEQDKIKLKELNSEINKRNKTTENIKSLYKSFSKNEIDTMINQLSEKEKQELENECIANLDEFSKKRHKENKTSREVNLRLFFREKHIDKTTSIECFAKKEKGIDLNKAKKEISNLEKEAREIKSQS